MRLSGLCSTRVRTRSTTYLAWSLTGLSAGLALAAAVLHVLNRHVDVEITHWWVTNAVIALGLGIPGGLIASRRRGNPIGWILLAVSIAQALTAAGREYAVYALGTQHGSLPGGGWGAWLGSWTWLLVGLIGVVFVLFPEGRTRSRLWLAPVVLVVGATGLLAFGSAVSPGPIFGGSPGPAPSNPVGWPGAMSAIGWLGYDRLIYTLFAGLVLGLVAMLGRLGGAGPALRRQLFVVWPAAALLTAELIWENWGSDSIGAVTSPIVTTLFAIAVAAAILRYGLYDIDLVLNRALVYALVSALLVGAYLGTVAAANSVFGHAGLAGSLAGAALVALLFAPLRLRLQHATDRLLYGERRDPYLVMASLGERLPEAGAALPALAATVARTLKLPYVAIELERDGELVPAACAGSQRGEPLILPLVYQGAAVGRLTLGRRAPGDAFTRAEEKLFGDIARQVGVTAYAVRLTEDLQSSRGRLVLAREEERRRVRRDLHDGLGPTLAGIALQLDAARALLQRDPQAVEERLATLVAETQAAIADVRRLVYDLRPPALDELGLVPALRQQAARFPGLEIVVQAPDELGDLPAAVEVAAYRIATEAVTNVARHAAAGRCTVRLALNGALELEVADDGCGMNPGWRPGVGVTSIRERAAELGGSCVLVPSPSGGTVVRARLPVAAR
jgi:two-component system, NarL family, sensor kinase